MKDEYSQPKDLLETRIILSLISAFHLTEAFLDDLLEKIDITSPFTKDIPQETRTKKPRFTDLMLLLAELSTEDKDPLGPEDLITVLNNLNSNPNASIIDLVSMSRTTKNISLIDYIPKDILENRSRTSTISEAVVKMIDEHFDDHQCLQIKKLLKRFTATTSEYTKLVEILISITTKLEPAEKIVFISKLVESSIFYGDNLNLGEPNNPFIALLEKIAVIGPNEFNNLVLSEREFLKQCTKEQQSQFFVESPISDKKVLPGLAQKTLTYFTNILPDILEMQEPAFPYAILSPLAHKILLMTPVKELTEVSQVEKEVKGEDPDSDKYPGAFVRLFKKINDLANKYPGSKRQFLALVNNHLSNYSPDQNSQLLSYLDHFILTLENTFQKLPSSLVLALCVEYNKGTPNLGPKELLEVVAKLNRELPDNSQKLLVLKAIILSAQDEVYDKADIEKLIDFLKTNPELGNSLTQIFNQVPVPPLKKLLEYTDETSLNTFHATYLKNPCPRDPDNGFKVDKANQQLNLFRIYEQAPPPGQAEAKKPEVALVNSQEFSKKSLTMRERSNGELLDIFHQYNPKNEAYNQEQAQDLDTLVAVAAELLYRSKGKEVRDAKGQLIPGCSMEINTTQYLAVLSFLKNSPHVTAQIGTGEGKSRITAIVNACLLAQGKTVDSATSDIQLATRDYLEFQPYFDLLGVETAMIYSDSSPEEYRIGGLNVSDVPSLSQFRNMARSQNNGDEVIDSDSSMRALVLDEADKLLYDLTHNHFNISKESDKAIKGMTWVYPLLMDYFAQQSLTIDEPIQGKNTISPLDLYYEDIGLSNKKFKQFAATRCNEANLKRLNALSDKQIEQWQTSAVTANALKFKVDFDIEADTLVQTYEGLKFSSQALIRFENQVIKNSTYSFGVHSCLHARLNTLRNNPAAVNEPLLKEALSRCETSFHIPEEKQIVYSSTSQDLLDDYEDGVIKALTGTSGSPIERREAQKMGMQFIDVPRHKGLNRKDRAIRLTANEKQQQDSILEEIKAGIAKNQPLLIVAENDLESAAIFKDLQTRLGGASAKLQYIDSQTSDSAFKDIIKRPRAPGDIIVSTNRTGRGTDFKLLAEAKQYGHKIIGTYLPSPRDTEQFFGRAGRYGDAGETLLILDKKRLKQRLGKNSLTDGYYTNPEAYIAHQQALTNLKEQRQRLLIQHTLSPFKREIRNHYFRSLFSEVTPFDFSKLENAWANFDQDNTQSWNSMWPKIQTELAKNTVDIEALNQLLTQYRSGLSHQWTALITKLDGEIKITSRNGSVINPGNYLKAEHIPVLEIKPDIQALLSYSKIPAIREEKVYDYYDINHEGRHTKYKHWYIPTVASLKGFANLLPLVHFENARRPFANTRAWMEDHGLLFSDFRANPNKGKILGALLLAVLGGGLGAALTVLGFTTPLGISLLGLSATVLNLITYTAGGLLAGGLTGLSVGAVIDAYKKPRDRIGDVGPENSPGSSYLRIMDGTGKVLSPTKTATNQPPSSNTFTWNQPPNLAEQPGPRSPLTPPR